VNKKKKNGEQHPDWMVSYLRTYKIIEQKGGVNNVDKKKLLGGVWCAMTALRIG